MRLERAKRRPTAKPLEDMILFAVNETRFAIPANAVDEIRNMEDLKPHQAGFMSKLAKVKFTLVRRNKDREKIYFVVDPSAHFRTTPCRASRVLVLRNSPAALLADGIERMVQISAVFAMPHAFEGEERNWYRGLAVIDGKVVPVINPDSILNKGELAVLLAGAKAARVSAPAAGAASA